MEMITLHDTDVARAIALLAPLDPVVVGRCPVDGCALCRPGLDVAA